MRWWWLALFPVFAFCETRAPATPDLRVESVPVAGGAELLTVFARYPQPNGVQGPEVPLVSVLRDNLGDQDPENDRLRYVWVLTSARPSVLQRATAALPFFYFHPDPNKNAGARPVPVIDLGATSNNVWSSIAGTLTQVLALDPEGAIVRSSTRSYRNNLEDHRQMHLLEALAILSQLEAQSEAAPESDTLLTEPELMEMQTRLTLAGQTLGGLVSAEKLPGAYVKLRTHADEERGHNWELLRQHAEANGLYFEPLGLNGVTTHALLWIASADIPEDDNKPHKFDGQFLGISDPYRDPKLRNWTGYREIRDGQMMIPLALYGLEYPKVPLLLVDFRSTYSTKRREMLRHAITDTVTGVFGISRFTNLPYLAGSTVFAFVRIRHGATENRAARLKAYSQVRQWLALDPSIDPDLRAELQRRLEMMGVNPMEESVFAEASIAQRQYAALLRYASDPHGLPLRIAHDRQAEWIADHHNVAARTGLRVANLVTFGRYSPGEKDESALEASLDQERRLTRETRFLEAVAGSSPQAEIVWNMDEVRHAVDQLSATHLPLRSQQALERILSKTKDEETREACERALQSQ